MQQKRWDGDVRGRGIASAAGATGDVRRLMTEMAAPDWIAEAPEDHLLPHLRAFVERPDSSWRLLSTETSSDGRFLVHLTWIGEQLNRGRLRAEVFALIGSVAENSTHVRERRTDRGVEYEVATGILDGDGGWRGHGHVLLICIDTV
ncbi:MAG: hypothetical protein JOZ41_14970 [Chloroflexi bacterium]|nr:hypothetical protein [Chloroflexota bacterium]